MGERTQVRQPVLLEDPKRDDDWLRGIGRTPQRVGNGRNENLLEAFPTLVGRAKVEDAVYSSFNVRSRPPKHLVQCVELQLVSSGRCEHGSGRACVMNLRRRLSHVGVSTAVAERESTMQALRRG